MINRAPDGAERRNPTAAEVCRAAGVSRNSLYRYHPSVMQVLRQYQQKHSAIRAAARSKADLPIKSEIAAMREQVVKLAALVDHYYGAYREINALLQRRERELADLRRGLDSKPIVLQR
jgi:AcrR family transcriptional regulator